MGPPMYRWIISEQAAIVRLALSTATRRRSRGGGDEALSVSVSCSYSLFNQGSAFRCWNHSRGSPHKKWKSCLLFKLFDGVAEIRLRNIEIPCSLAERAGIRDFYRIKVLFDSHNITPAFM